MNKPVNPWLDENPFAFKRQRNVPDIKLLVHSLAIVILALHAGGKKDIVTIDDEVKFIMIVIVIFIGKKKKGRVPPRPLCFFGSDPLWPDKRPYDWKR